MQINETYRNKEKIHQQQNNKLKESLLYKVEAFVLERELLQLFNNQTQQQPPSLPNKLSEIQITSKEELSKIQTAVHPTLEIPAKVENTPAVINKRMQPVFPRIVEYDLRLENITSSQNKPEKIAEGFEWVEGPAWNWKENYLVFSDIPRNTIFKWNEQQGFSSFLYPSGYMGTSVFRGKEPGSNGLTYNEEGELFVCQHGERRIVKLGKNNEAVIIADRYEGKRLNSPNDLVFKSTGELYFTDPPYGLPLRTNDPAKEQPFSGIYRVKDGKVELLCDELKMPNGLAFSPNEQYLYVSNSGKKDIGDTPAWYRFPVREDGTLGPKELFYNAEPLNRYNPGSPDGLKVDENGNLYCAGPGGVYIFSSEAELLGLIEFGVPTSNCCWSHDKSWLYITAEHAVWRIQFKTKGTGVFFGKPPVET